MTSPSCDDVVLAFERASCRRPARACFAAERDEVVVGDGLGADEAALEVGVDDARRLPAPWRRGAPSRRALPSGRR